MTTSYTFAAAFDGDVLLSHLRAPDYDKAVDLALQQAAKHFDIRCRKNEIESRLAGFSIEPTFDDQQILCLHHLTTYVEEAPDSDPGRGHWEDCDDANGCGKREERAEAAHFMRRLLDAFGFPAPSGKPICPGCSRYAHSNEHDPYCDLTSEEAA